ncbi:hypothetical protein BX616_005429 [Lobosporangium transversale]|nr:hypothetical protein BX616_005429 [Lobosporangium transversale]
MPGKLEFISARERAVAYRSCRLEENTKNGTFHLHPVLQTALNNIGLMSIKDDLAQPINCIVIEGKKIKSFKKSSTKDFRRLVFKATYPVLTPLMRNLFERRPDPKLNASFWMSFWCLPLPRNARNVWWRLLIDKLPFGVHLHRYMPNKSLLICQMCRRFPETEQHLLFSYPKKLEVWQGAMKKFVGENDWSAFLLESLFYANPTKINPLNNVPAFLLLSTILATIWKYHHACVRRGEDFDVPRVLAGTDIALNQVINQLEEKRKRGKERRN